jgi:hypothetical protein
MIMIEIVQCMNSALRRKSSHPTVDADCEKEVEGRRRNITKGFDCRKHGFRR